MNDRRLQDDPAYYNQVSHGFYTQNRAEIPHLNGEAFWGKLLGCDRIKSICYGTIQSTCIIVHYSVLATMPGTGMGTT